MWAGAKAYDLVAGGRRALPASYYISRDEALYQFPMLKADGLKGACIVSVSSFQLCGSGDAWQKA
jgi:glycerol-3-phosphate dehydrogenase